jgi:DNA-binding XRE family transcriptional regulator
MTTSPREALAEVLGAIRQSDDLITLAQIATTAGITSRQMANALHARPVNAVAHLRLCAALGFDPLPEIPHPMVSPADFDFVVLSLALRLRRRLNNQTQRECAKAVGTSAKTIVDMERARAHSIGVLLRTCVYVGVHPFGYFRPVKVPIVSRETVRSAVSLEGSPGR